MSGYGGYDQGHQGGGGGYQGGYGGGYQPPPQPPQGYQSYPGGPPPQHHGAPPQQHGYNQYAPQHAPQPGYNSYGPPGGPPPSQYGGGSHYQAPHPSGQGPYGYSTHGGGDGGSGDHYRGHEPGYGGYGGPHRSGPPPPSAPQQFGHGAPEGYTFQYSNCSGKRKALLIGINYFGQEGELRGCVNDVKNVSAFLIERYGYKREDMVILTDDQQDPRMIPIKENILKAAAWLVRGAQPNDALFFHYSGTFRIFDKFGPPNILHKPYTNMHTYTYLHRDIC